MHRITNVVELYVYYILIMYYYVGYCRTIIILLGEGPEGEVGRGRGPRGRLAGCRLRGVSPRALAARGSRLASPRASPRAPRQGLEGFHRGRHGYGCGCRCGYGCGCGSRFRLCGEMRFPETERERERERERDSLAFPGNIYLPHLPPSPRRQDPDCRPVPTHVILTRTIPPDSDYRVITGYSMVSMDSMVSGYILCIFQGFQGFLAVLYTFASP